jgi:hypothetical protein
MSDLMHIASSVDHIIISEDDISSVFVPEGEAIIQFMMKSGAHVLLKCASEEEAKYIFKHLCSCI